MERVPGTAVVGPHLRCGVPQVSVNAAGPEVGGLHHMRISGEHHTVHRRSVPSLMPADHGRLDAASTAPATGERVVPLAHFGGTDIELVLSGHLQQPIDYLQE